MKVELHCYRIYGADTSYSGKPFDKPKNSPICVPDFTCDDITLKIHIGDIDSDLKDAVIINQALNTLDHLIPESKPQLTGEERINIALRENRHKNIFKNTEWLIAIEAIIEIDVPESKLHDRGKHFWLDVNYARSTWFKYKDFLKSYFDDVLGFTMPYIGEEYIDSLKLEHYYYSPLSDELGFYTFPEHSMSAKMRYLKDTDNIDIDSIEKAIKLLIEKPKQVKFISTVRHWYVSTLHEDDPWKVFLWSFWGLEVLSRKYSDKYYNLIKGTEPTEQKLISSGHCFDSHVLQSLFPEKSRTSLTACFAIMSTVLCPDESKDDTTSFKKMMKIRNSLSHGVATQADDLPVYHIKNLFHKYFALAVEDIQ